MAEGLGEFEILERREIPGGGEEARARRASTGEDVVLWIGAAGCAGASPGAPAETARSLAKVIQAGLPRVVEAFVHGDRAVFVVQSYRGTRLEERRERASFSAVEAIDATGVAADSDFAVSGVEEPLQPGRAAPAAAAPTNTARQSQTINEEGF